MAINSSILPASALLNLPGIANYSLPLANTEYALVVPAGAKQFTLKARGQTMLKIADTVGLSGITYFSLPPFCDYQIDSVTGSNTITLYVQSTNPSQIVEILYWV